MCSQGMFWQFSKWNSHFTQRVCTCAREGELKRASGREEKRHMKGRANKLLPSQRQLNTLHFESC